jgi:hypothetical protein
LLPELKQTIKSPTDTQHLGSGGEPHTLKHPLLRDGEDRAFITYCFY